MIFIVIIFIFLCGLSIGSFINALVYRLENRLPIGYARSVCPECKHILAWYDLIPLISFFILRGKCRYCRKKISWHYPLVEFLMGVVVVLPLFKNLEFGIWNLEFGEYLRYFVFVVILMIIFAYDLRYMLIPDKISLPAIIITFFMQLPTTNYSLLTIVFAALIGFGFFFLQFIISKGTWIGGGDMRLGFLMGLMAGWPNIIAALLFAYSIGSVLTLPLVLAGKKGMKSPVPFGVFLTIATVIVLVWGNELVFVYKEFIS